MSDFLKRAGGLLLASMLTPWLAGCGALDPVNMILAARASTYDVAAELTSPEMREITLKSFRSADCTTLSSMIPLYQRDLNKGRAENNRVDIAVAEMNISAVQQIQGEKRCPPDKPQSAQAPAAAVKPIAATAATNKATATPAAAVQGTLGITVDTIPPAFAQAAGTADLKGSLVVAAKKGGAAEKAGVKPLDIVLEVNGQPVPTPADFNNVVSRMRPGYKAPLRIWRDGKTRNLTVLVSKDEQPTPVAVAAVPVVEPDTAPSLSSPPLATHGWLGIQYGMGALRMYEELPQPVAAMLGMPQAYGVMIGGALPGSAAEQAGIRTLDVLLSLNGRMLENRKQLADLIARLPAGSTVKLGVWRNRKQESLSVTLGAQALTLTMPPTAGGYCFAWISADTARQAGAISYEFVVSEADAVSDSNPAIGARFRAYMTERGLGAAIGDAPGNAVCRKTRDAIFKAREEATTVLKQSFSATGRDTLAVYWIPH